MEHYIKLKETHPELTKEYSEMTHEELLNQICAEVIDLHNMCDRVQLFMSECTENLSNTNYTIETLKGLISEKQENDINSFCSELMEMTPQEIMKELQERSDQWNN